MNERRRLHLFEAFGVELEYMIVSAETLSVRPIADEVLRAVAGGYVSDVELGDVSWSNELALHVIELKTTQPAASLSPWPERFQEHVRRINDVLAGHDALLMPTAMHPWIDPGRELKLWPHEYSAVYEAFDRIFNCRGHGWANLQSIHLNLPFADDAEFGRLHAAIRLVLPILPALAASSPIVECRVTGLCDSRLDYYRNNAASIPSVTGRVIPEPVFTRRGYETRILQRIYADVAPHDPHRILQHEWLNARGAIARFDRNAIEIRVLDVQESPRADLAICAATAEVLRALVEERWSRCGQHKAFDTEPLARILSEVIRHADEAVIDNADYLSLFGCSSRSVTAGELWARLLNATLFSRDREGNEWREPLQVILNEGPLARRIVSRLSGDMSRERIAATYRGLCDCLAEGKLFRAGGRGHPV